MSSKRIVVIAEGVQLVHQIDDVPEEHAVQIFAAYCADQPFNEWMRHGNMGN